MIEVLVSDRMGQRVIVKCLPEDTVHDFKQVLAAQLKMDVSKISVSRGKNVLRDHITLDDYEIHNGTNLELYYL
ncbi:hypothetical protein TBLA_0F04140 [Henningerozyma blattae CBS 6284]|uniref:Ubiquitin-like modifier HUB1 n=1 Tax=Henningerozyma blattae (strain ATCC 34711 / CBS 6284 / DSM 70876 / NBRC 10599 / NRRL Y-10934 / UCD 77-7) TaxID=1071380 RepID=I2H6E5_HENB6|nr:hypothetical protein TBLA_0F04140 [Tetrapisispora blattae CBS 6284]CCH61947.1 hypothetical protein TBLA_0F04140 [Tetrapisispora blattae CBS 6284]